MAGGMYGWWNLKYLDRFTPELRSQVEDWMRRFHADVQGNVGYVPGTVVHLCHGDRRDRRYGQRLKILRKFRFDPALDLRVSPEGIWEWTNRNPELERSVRKYFRTRQEDGPISAVDTAGQRSLRTASVFSDPAMKYTPFVDNADRLFLSKCGIQFNHRPELAEVIVSESDKVLIRYARTFGTRKRYMLWTAEPRRNTSFVPWLRNPGLPSIRVMNVYTGDTFTNNLCYLHKLIRWTQIRSSYPQLTSLPDLGDRTTVMVAGTQRHNTSVIRDGVDLDLYRLRYELGLIGHRFGLIDIYGRGWPTGISKGESRGSNWIERKREIIEGRYWFNLCFENTRIPNYCTEKIWDAIRMKCLPIYYGAPNIYDTFPHESFIDYGLLNSPDALFELVMDMTPAEFQVRYNRCVDTLNRCLPWRSTPMNRSSSACWKCCIVIGEFGLKLKR